MSKEEYVGGSWRIRWLAIAGSPGDNPGERVCAPPGIRLRRCTATLAGRFLSPIVVVRLVVVGPRASRSSSHRDERWRGVGFDMACYVLRQHLISILFNQLQQLCTPPCIFPCSCSNVMRLRASASGVRLRAPCETLAAGITFQLPPFVACLWLSLVWLGAGASGGGVLDAGWLDLSWFSFFLARPPISAGEKPRVGGTPGGALRGGSDGWRSPVPRSDNAGCDFL